MRPFVTTVFLSLAAASPSAFAGLVGYYTFEGNILDVSGNGNHGTFGPTAPTLTPSGFTGSTYEFGAGGANTFLTVPININPGVMPQVTFGAWVNADMNDEVIRGIISHDTGNFDRTLDVDTRGPSIGVADWCAFKGLPDGVACNGAVSTNTWVFLAVRYNAASGNISFTRDGVTVNTTGFPENNGTTSTYIGRNPNFDSPFIGRIDNAFFYDEYLTDERISDIYRNGIQVVVPEPSSLLLMGAGLGAFAFRRRALR